MPRRVIIAFALFSFACSKDPPKSNPTTTSASASATPSAVVETPSASTAGVVVLNGDCAISVPKTPGVANADTMFASLQPRFRGVYTHGLMNDPKQAGTYTFKASIGADGKITKLDATATGLSKEVTSAMDQVVKAAQFDVGGKATTISGSIECHPK